MLTWEPVRATKPNTPTILIIFGATGNLISKKIVPSLFNLYKKNKLPRLFKIIGFSRRNLDTLSFQKHISEILKNHKLKSKKTPPFLNLYTYQQGNFSKKESFKNLAKTLGEIDNSWSTCSNKLFYLAVPPPLYKTIFSQLADSNLAKPCSPEDGWTRVLVEKPFGKNLKTAKKLDSLLGKLFKEEQIYRIDHYLGKEMLQNILLFRFSNNLLEKSWNNHFIEKVEIKLWETKNIENRGTFYDPIGALRDVGQNHLLQMLALITMDNPLSFTSKQIRKMRAKTLKNLIPLSADKIKKHTFRAQYEGYKNTDNVPKTSKTETYFQTSAYLNSPKWAGTTFQLESGKALARQEKEITVTFKHPSPCLCPPGRHYKNKIIFRLEPKEEITIDFWAKQPGLEMHLKEGKFKFAYQDRKEKFQYTQEYEKLLLDCIMGDQTLFVSTEEVKAMWSFIDPILKGWKNNLVPLKTYKQGTLPNVIRKDKQKKLNKEIGIIGLGKMGSNLALQLTEKQWKVHGYNRTAKVTQKLEKHGIIGTYSLKELIQNLKKPRVIWSMLPAGKPTEDALKKVESLLDKNDIIIDGANSYYKDSIKRYKKLKQRNIKFVDVGVSGGPEGARNGASLMIGGNKQNYNYLLPLFTDISTPNGFQFFEGEGAGHFVKMVHNGIEYGMMQAIAEGFNIMKHSNYKLNLTNIARVYNHGSVIESRLVNWLKQAFELHGENLTNISATVAHSGEGEWTVKEAKEKQLKAKVIEQALKFRIQSEKNPSYTGKILSALREQFGGHRVS